MDLAEEDAAVVVGNIYAGCVWGMAIAGPALTGRVPRADDLVKAWYCFVCYEVLSFSVSRRCPSMGDLGW